MANEEQNKQEFVEAMEFYFEEVGTMTDNGYRMENPELLRKRAESGDEQASVVYDVYLEIINNDTPPVVTRQITLTSYLQCFIEESFGVYIALIQGDLAEALVAAIEGQLWDEVATLVAQITGLGVGVIGGAATAAQLMVAAFVCGLE